MSDTGPDQDRPGAKPRVSVVVVTYNALPWIEQCLASVESQELIVVDHGSADGTVAFVRERFPQAHVVEQENRGLAAGWNAGLARASGEYHFLLNADAWVVGDGLERLVETIERHPRAAIVGPIVRGPDGSLQRSVRGFPTLWRLATEYLFLRKLAPRSRLLNGFYAGDFGYDRECQAEFLMGAALLLRPRAEKEVGPFDEDFFLFSEEVDWCYRARKAGWSIVFTPSAEVRHVGGAAHAGRFFRDQVVGHLRFLDKHRGRRDARRARVLLAAALTLRGLLFRGERGRGYRDAASFLRAHSLEELLAWRRR